MKAQEVLRRYAAGERNFCNANLRGANFKGQDLSGANFSGADIRSANFTDATLRDANFTKAQGGLQRRWMVVQLCLIVVLAGLSGIMQGFSGALAAAWFFDGSTDGLIIGCAYVLLLMVGFAAIALQGLKIRAFGTIVIACASACASAIAIAIAFAGAGAIAFAGAGAIAGTGTGTVAVAGTGADVFAGAGTVAGAFFLLSLYVARQVLKEDEKFAIVRLFGLALSALGGTSFCGADLTRATFNQALLKSTNFANSRQRETTFTHVYWQGADKLDCARLGDAIVQDRRVRILLTTPEKGYKQDLTDANLRGANLKGATLEGAVLRRAMLSDAKLEKAVLKDAMLTEAQAIHADFTGACLTGATLEAWNIDNTTVLKAIDCQYVFFLEHPNEKGSRERLPHDTDKMFQPGDFEKLFKEMLDEVQILIRNGIDPIAFKAAIQNIREQNPEINQDSFKGMEKQGDDVLIKLQVPEGTDKAKIERDWDSGYQLGLKEGRNAALLENAEDIKELAFLALKNPVSINNHIRTKSVTGNDQSQNIDVKGDFNINAHQSVVSLRDISGQVTNQISALSNEPTRTQLKDMLAQLQTAIEAESSLSEEEKTDALAEVKELVTAGQAPQEGPMKKMAKRSLNTLKGITLGMGATTELVKACGALLPAIAHLFGL
jgi:uncharacterized protein YjbI with pentapeptide repeats